MGRVNLYDKALIEDFSETDEGYLTVKAPITRPGVFPYLTKDGAVEMQGKLPEELFSDKTIKSANAKPVTDDHPHEAVTAKNFTKYSKGMTHTDARVENNTLVVSFTVTDSATILCRHFSVCTSIPGNFLKYPIHHFHWTLKLMTPKWLRIIILELCSKCPRTISPKLQFRIFKNVHLFNKG